jgi:hypothetical protein
MAPEKMDRKKRLGRKKWQQKELYKQTFEVASEGN